MGARMVREVARKTNDMAGDGTTTATVLARAILREGMKSVAVGMNLMDLKRGIGKAVAQVVEEIQKRSKKVKDAAEIAQVGTVASNGGESHRQRFFHLDRRRLENVEQVPVTTIEAFEHVLQLLSQRPARVPEPCSGYDWRASCRSD
jgi:hypothetical protein